MHTTRNNKIPLCAMLDQAVKRFLEENNKFCFSLHGINVLLSRTKRRRRLGAKNNNNARNGRKQTKMGFLGGGASEKEAL